MIQRCAAKGAAICVGLDPVYERLPKKLRSVPGDAGPAQQLEAIQRFCTAVLEVVGPLVPCVKIQSACFERYGWEGVRVYDRLTDQAARLGLLVIADGKRGDIGASARHYAAGHLRPADDPDAPGADALTVQSYFGLDGLEPFLAAATTAGRGLFALVRTSNPGGDAVQALRLADGRTVAEAVAEMVASAGSQWLGQSGYSLLGAVVGATKSTDLRRLRELMPQQILLVPGFGAQGADASHVAACFRPDGTGALITASRSILYAYEGRPGQDWREAIKQAACKMKQQIQAIRP